MKVISVKYSLATEDYDDVLHLLLDDENGLTQAEEVWVGTYILSNFRVSSEQDRFEANKNAVYAGFGVQPTNLPAEGLEIMKEVRWKRNEERDCWEHALR